MMGKLQEAQKQADEIKSRLDTVYLKEGNDDITVTITGNREIKDIEISDSLLEDKEELQDKLVLALNKAIEKANRTHEEAIRKVVEEIKERGWDEYL